jgi:hypothetical protein
MGLTVTIIVLVVLAILLGALLTGVMGAPRHLRPHRARGGRPAARMRFRRRNRNV